MKESPFAYGTTVRNKSFTNREEEVQRLKRNFKDGINTIIISPRRWGKSSLVEKVASSFDKNKNIKLVVIDLFTVSTEEAFLELYAKVGCKG